MSHTFMQAENDNNDSIFEAFLKATPIFPQYKPPDVVKIEEEINPSKVELYEDLSNFLPSRGSNGMVYAVLANILKMYI